MITRTMTFTLSPEARDKMVPEFEKMCEASEAEDGCITFRVYSDMFDSSTIRLYEEFDSLEAYKAHYQTIHYKAIMAVFSTLEEGDMTVHTQGLYEVTSIEIN